MNKHTPGPGVIDEHVTIDRIDKARIIRPADLDNYEYGATAIVGTSEADARLIAAAPDLLEALQALMKNYEIVNGLGFNRFAVAKAFNAISKATGENK